MMKLYRIQSIRKESLWYSFDGEFKDRLKDVTGQEIPMPFDKNRKSLRIKDPKVKFLSSVESLDMFPNWFSKDQINKLFNSGYSLFEYEVDKGIYLPKGEVLFDFNKVINSNEIQMEILKSYDF